MTEERKTGREAQMSNIRAAVQVAETVRSTLGPAGMDKMLVDERGDTIVTNDGITILRELSTGHPGARMMVQASQTQEEVCKDGTTSVVVLAGQMLALSEGLLMRGIHPQTIVRSFTRASQYALAPENIPGGWGTDENTFHKVAATALRGKASESYLEHAAYLCVKAVGKVGGKTENVRILTQVGETMGDSYIHEGIVLNKTFVNPDYEGHENATVLMLDGGLDGFNYADVQMQISDPAQLAAIREQEMEILSNVARRIVDLGVNVLIVRDAIHEAVAKFLDNNGVGVVSRVQQSDVDAISRVSGIPIYHRITEVPEDLRTHSLTVMNKRIGDLDYVAIECEDSSTVTLIVRGATRQTLDEYERAFDDAIGVTALAMREKSVYPGGGAVYSRLSQITREMAKDTPGLSARERMCMEAYADSLEIIPAAIASNAGMDPLDVVMELRACPEGHGLYINHVGEGEVTDTGEHGVFEPASLVIQVVNSATEVACAILRIDDIIARRSDG